MRVTSDRASPSVLVPASMPIRRPADPIRAAKAAMSPKVSPRVAFLSAVSSRLCRLVRHVGVRSLSWSRAHLILRCGRGFRIPHRGNFGDVHPRVERVQERQRRRAAEASPAADRAPPARAALPCWRCSSPRASFPLSFCSPSSRCSPRWCCRCSAARPRCGRWRCCFFQAALLAGYGYAHLLMRYVPAASTGFVHLAIALAALVVLPIGLPSGWTRAAAGRALLLAARPFHRRRRTAVRRRRRQRAAAAGLVCADRPPARARSLLPLRRLQPRQPHRAARLSVPVRAGAGPDGP